MTKSENLQRSTKIIFNMIYRIRQCISTTEIKFKLPFSYESSLAKLQLSFSLNPIYFTRLLLCRKIEWFDMYTSRRSGRQAGRLPDEALRVFTQY